ncbi:MAG TPA: M48 family metallopeptidase [Noviherbaspirillum sp.]|jgi:predicted Zn-dependent protease|uniref:M48 family metallopeptidase n=1 Tax=Noviherbaspirillum sp. TaxID=1926288 RepID=UPI002F95DB6E
MKAIVESVFLKRLACAAALACLAACETVQTTQSGVVGVDRQQRMAVAAGALEQAATEQYSALIAKEKQKGTLNTNPAYVQRVRAIANRIVPQTVHFRPDARNWPWEVNVLTAPEVNAWCMPGGKIAVYTGLIEKLNATDDELAAVMGHEIAHALREHARERASEQMVASGALSVGAALLGLGDIGQKGAEFAYMGLVGLPNSRRHETEADRVGIELAARAGYNPQAAVTLWQKMGQLGGGEPIKFLSTHPTQSDRLSDLTAYSQRVMPLYQQARGSR